MKSTMGMLNDQKVINCGFNITSKIVDRKKTKKKHLRFSNKSFQYNQRTNQ